jgi:predicted DNA-binding transcriptional regulator YafY
VLQFATPEPVGTQICRAIAEKKLIEIWYQAQSRVVEPHDFGVQNGAERLLAYQLRSSRAAFGKDTVGWRLFDLAKIESIVILDMPFKGSRAAAHQDHHAWDTIYARVK